MADEDNDDISADDWAAALAEQQAVTPDPVASVPDMAGVKPGGVPIIGTKHTWTATQPQLEGLVTYLRALPPLGFEEQ